MDIFRKKGGAMHVGPACFYPTTTNDAGFYSLVALEPDTGKRRWAYQEIPDYEWDFDSAYEVILIDSTVNGRLRKLLVHMNKSGIVFVLDRVTGQFVKAFTVPEVQTWISGITEEGKLIGRQSPGRGKPVTLCPAPAGAKSRNQMAYSPRTGYIYTPTIEICSEITANRGEPREGLMFSGGSAASRLPPGRDTISRIDAYYSEKPSAPSFFIRKREK